MILPKADCKLERRQLNYGRRLFSFVRIMIRFSVCFNFCLPSLSKNHIIYWEKACQFSKTSKKVCPGRVGRAGKSRKGHTRESKQGEKYARGASTERENCNKDAKIANVRKWEIFHIKICQNKHSNCEL